MNKLFYDFGIAVAIFIAIELLFKQQRNSVNIATPKKGRGDILPDQGQRDNPRYVMNEVALMYGKDIARKVEKIYRLETRDFDSRQYKIGRSPGMVAVRNTFPYGWTTLESFWLQNPSLVPTGLDLWPKGTTSADKDLSYIKFPNLLAAAMTLAAFLKAKNGNVGRWFSTKPDAQRAYSKLVNQRPAKYV